MQGRKVVGCLGVYNERTDGKNGSDNNYTNNANANEKGVE